MFKKYWLSLNNSSLSLFNQILVAFAPAATDGFDEGYDAVKLKGNPDIALYSVVGNTDCIIQGLPPLTQETTVKIGMDLSNAGNYVFTGFNKNDFPTDFVYLIDLEEGKIQDLKADSQFRFYAKAGTNKSRFVLKFTKKSFVFANIDRFSTF